VHLVARLLDFRFTQVNRSFRGWLPRMDSNHE
jgi:hypothetical protein